MIAPGFITQREDLQLGFFECGSPGEVESSLLFLPG